MVYESLVWWSLTWGGGGGWGLLPHFALEKQPESVC